ncbi:hypothetical protein ACFXTN_013742 [Malus domestica]
MTEQSENPSSPSGQVAPDSPTTSERSQGNGSNEELQATMIQVLKSMEMISLETKGEVSRLCMLTGNLQRRLDLEFSTPKDAQGSGISRVITRDEPIIPLFPLLEETGDRGKKKVILEGSQPAMEPILMTEFLSFPLLSYNNKGKDEQERMRYGMPGMMGETSGKETTTTTTTTTSDKPPPYRPPPMVNKGGRSNWRKPEPRREANAGNDRSPKIRSAILGHNDNLATQ